METEIIIYGTFCSICSVLAIFSDYKNLTYALLSTFCLAFFWAGSIFLWSINSLEYSVLADTVFLLLSLVLFWMGGLRWLLILAMLYSGNVILDILYLNKVLSYEVYAWSSNGLFVAELITGCHSGIVNLFKMLTRWMSSHKVSHEVV